MDQTALKPSWRTAPPAAPAARPAPAEREFTGRSVLVTGAGGGVGAAVVDLLARRGARVLAADRAAQPLRRTTDDGAPIRTYLLDVTDGWAVERTVEEIERSLGPLSALVNVAGAPRTTAATELTDQDWRETFAVNSDGVFYTSRAVAARMAARGSGCVVTVGSNASGVPLGGLAAYTASHAAAAQFTKCLGLELEPSGVRCNVVSPTGGASAGPRPPHRAATPGRTASGRPASPLDGSGGRGAEPADIAEAVAFLLSDRARHITMHDLYVDGGAPPRC